MTNSNSTGTNTGLIPLRSHSQIPRSDIRHFTLLREHGRVGTDVGDTAPEGTKVRISRDVSNSNTRESPVSPYALPNGSHCELITMTNMMIDNNNKDVLTPTDQSIPNSY